MELDHAAMNKRINSRTDNQQEYIPQIQNASFAEPVHWTSPFHSHHLTKLSLFPRVVIIIAQKLLFMQ